MRASSSPWLPFRWIGETLSGRFFPHAVMAVHGTLPALQNLPGWYQFDLGAPNSVLYENAFTPEQRARLQAQPRWPKQALLNGQPMPVLDTALQVGPWQVRPLVWYEGFGGQDDASDGPPLLGTLGANFVRGRALVVDFPRQRLTLWEKVPPDWEATTRWAPLRSTEHGHVLVQVAVNGKPRWVLYDTGSSIFPLLTDADQWMDLTSGQVTHTLTVQAWGQPLVTYAARPRIRLTLGGQPLELPWVYYNQAPEWRAFFREHDLLGIMGNAPFLNKILVLDFPGGRCGVHD